MKQYLDLLKDIKFKGALKPPAREGMPGTISLFGHQFRHDLSKGFPSLTTKKLYWKGVVVELLWFLRGDTNLKFMIDNGVNIWNEDGYNYYSKMHMEAGLEPLDRLPYDRFVSKIREGDLGYEDQIPGYNLGDCGFQYGKVWRDWGGYGIESLDQIRNVINSLKNNPESRRHIVTAVDPENDKDLALYWCHSMFQFNCRPLTREQRIDWLLKKEGVGPDSSLHGVNLSTVNVDDHPYHKVPKYYLDCQMYQRSADAFLGVPFNIASYALLTHIIAEICNMVPGDFVHTFGDVHIYEDHMEAVDVQLNRRPDVLPKLIINSEFWGLDALLDTASVDFFKHIEIDDFQLEKYNPAPSIKAKLSTGLK